MSRPVLSPRAVGDLDEIWDYTAARSSVEQAERYIRQIQAAVQSLAADPRLGRPCDEIRPGYRKFAAGSHVLFYRVMGDAIDVVRILHARMDYGAHL